MLVKAGDYSIASAKRWLRKEDSKYHPEEVSDIGWINNNFSKISEFNLKLRVNSEGNQ